MRNLLDPSVIQAQITDTNRNIGVQINLRDWVRMMDEGLVPKKDVVRVEVNDDGTVNILDFTLPSKAGMKRFNTPQKDVERWIMESISMLRITNENSLVPELGFKVSDTLYYILNREGEMK